MIDFFNDPIFIGCGICAALLLAFWIGAEFGYRITRAEIRDRLIDVDRSSSSTERCEVCLRIFDHVLNEQPAAEGGAR